MTKEDYQNIIFSQLDDLNLPSIQRRFIAYKLAEAEETAIIKAQIIGATLFIETELNKYKTEIHLVDLPINSIIKIL